MTSHQSSESREQRFYQPYLEAEWGLKNHWYPGLFSHELEEGSVRGIEIAGEPILLRRAKGNVSDGRTRASQGSSFTLRLMAHFSLIGPALAFRSPGGSDVWRRAVSRAGDTRRSP